MNKKEEFKEFIRSKPELVEYIKNKEMTMQQFYELYDVYGTSEEAWKPYLKEDERGINITPSKITDFMKNINLDEIQKHINTAQKALGVVEDLTTKGSVKDLNITKGPASPRPLNKFFED